MVDDVYKVELHEGNTMVIPTGWIHAVVSLDDSWGHIHLTPCAAYSYGHTGVRRELSAFLQCCHTYGILAANAQYSLTPNIAELKVRNIEIATQVPKKFRFPMFSKYGFDSYLKTTSSVDILGFVGTSGIRFCETLNYLEGQPCQLESLNQCQLWPNF